MPIRINANGSTCLKLIETCNLSISQDICDRGHCKNDCNDPLFKSILVFILICFYVLFSSLDISASIADLFNLILSYDAISLLLSCRCRCRHRFQLVCLKALHLAGYTTIHWWWHRCSHCLYHPAPRLSLCTRHKRHCHR